MDDKEKQAVALNILEVLEDSNVKVKFKDIKSIFTMAFDLIITTHNGCMASKTLSELRIKNTSL